MQGVVSSLLSSVLSSVLIVGGVVGGVGVGMYNTHDNNWFRNGSVWCLATLHDMLL